MLSSPINLWSQSGAFNAFLEEAIKTGSHLPVHPLNKIFKYVTKQDQIQ